ncbi:Hypothetical predicted protein [Cloeon dipterum]|uniref:Myosin motor domain-containing protein n=1 Tax=Cloeon dipterum TaxID=197152 RepID=A0A8S1C375_9INSE|nr:Hypothetical predicted protein [Cloeon dipterum]
MEFEKGDLVWFDPGIGYVLPGEVLEYHRAGQVVTVQALIAGKPQVFTLTSLNGVKKRQDLGLTGLDDMIQLSDLNEASLLWNLKIRYDKELIYTYTGSILVAVNPYKMFDIYGLDMVKKYEGQIMGTLPPHLFAVGSCAYSRMSKDSESQVVVISGESGSGKTESTKLVMQYLAAVNKATSNLITEQILEASPLLESFGNAKTVKNDNSSRFGKYLDVHFKQGVIVGAKITEYLLEKSRIVTQAQDERNYHIFYEMLKGLNAEEKEKYGLLTAEKYFYLNQGGSCEIDGKNDLEDFQSLLSAMQVLGLNSDEQDTIFRILASVLHLGNVYFHRKQLKHGQEGVEIGSDAEIRWAGHLLQLNVDGIKRSLTMKITEARNERLFTPLSIDQALDARDAFAKSLYSTLFSWLVARINQIVCKGGKRTAISILDIFGFEDFKENSFEQLCINYANENLQFYFNKHIFKLEQQEYAKEKIEWQTITYTDNLPVIHLIAKKPVGILHLLDDESNFPKATDISFLEKCHYNHALNELYSRPRMSSMEFGIRHYAGQVWYNVEGFLDKNRDTLRQDVVELLIGSKIPMVSKMFQSLRNYQETTKTLNKANGRFVTMKPRTPTVAARFHDSLQQLLESMSKCNPWFVRCIKPNNEKAAMKFDMPVVLEQLRYTGMLETIRIRKTGYPVRLRFGQFVERYRYLLGPTALPKGTPLREVCRAILDREPENYQLGTHRVFLRETLERRLEEERARVLGTAVLKIQKNVRSYLARRKFQQQKRAAVTVQTAYRGYAARKNFRLKRKVALKAQANYKMKKERKRFTEMKAELKRRAEVEKMARERAKSKAHKEEQERTSRAVAGVNHLEIPAELAFIFSKLDDWQPIHSERNLVKVVGALPSRSDRYYLPHDIDQHAFTKFTNIYFKSHVWGMKREPIKTPFLAKNKDIDYQDSLAIFKLILRFMNDNNLSPKKEQALGDYIVNKGLISDKMRDEILCQLCNQTWKNENEANNERGWLLMANCLSCFPPSKTFYKYLLKYVSDSAYNGYKAACQRKLLQSARAECQLARAYPPCLLEWRANRKRVNMSLECQFPDGEVRSTPVESWTTGEELAGLVIRDRGIAECHGWTVSCHSEDDNEGEVREMCGFDYVLDLVSEMELAPAFPVVKNYFLVSGKKGKRMPQFSSMGALTVDIDDHSPRRPANPPPEPPVTKQISRKMSHEVISEKWADSQQPGRTRSQSRDHTNDIGLSRKSALNDRYFEEKTRSRSLDNLLGDEAVPTRKLQNLGLSQSKLNDRYRSIEKLEVPVMVHNQEYMTRNEVEEALESISQRGVSKMNDDVPKSQWSKFGLSGSNLNDRYFKENHADAQSELDSEFSTPNIQPEFLDRGRPRRPPSVDNSVNKRRVSASDFDNYRDKNNFNTGSTHDGQLARHDGSSTSQLPSNGHDDFDFGHGRLGRGHPRFIKSHNAAKRTPGSHSSRNYLEKSEYSVKSSALSDTSEAPSLASHVRRVRVPSQASDVDQFLDDLFMPVLDGNLDELSDARSLAASLKGGGQKGQGGQVECGHEEEVDHEVASITQSLSRTRRGICAASSQAEAVNSESVDDYIQGLLAPVSLNGSLKKLSSATTLADTIKGGGDSIGGLETSSQAKGFGFTPIPGMTSPTPMGMMSGMMSPTQMMMPTIPVYTPTAQAAFMTPGGLSTSAGSPTFFSTPMGGEQASIPTPFSATPGQQQPFVPVPIYNMQGLNLPFNQMDPGQVAAYQQNLQRAFLQSAMAQNMQIQHQLMAQNQALQQMLQVQASPSTSSGPVQGGAPEMTPPPPPPQFPPPLSSGAAQPQRSAPQQSSNLFTPVSSKESGVPRKSSAKGTSQHAAFGNVLTELKNRKVSQDSVGKQNQAIPPPPPMPPAPENCDPSGSRPFVDVYGRAKTVRIGKWRWPPPKESVDQNPDSFMEFKIRQHHRKSAQHQHPIDLGDNGMGYDRNDSVEWEEFEVEGQPTPKETTPVKKNSVEHKTDVSGFKAFEIGPRKTTPGSIGKLRISSEMRQKLEMVTANHSMRSTTKPEKPSLLPMKEQRAVKKLEDNRKLLLEQQLAGRWDTVDSVEAVTKDMSRGQDKTPTGRFEDNRRPAPPPPPVTPHFMEQSIPQHHPPSRSSSFYSSNTNQVPEPKSPPPPIQPIKSDSYQMQQRVQERRSSVSTHHTDKADRIEIEESSEFLQPVDSSTPVSIDREFARSLENIKTKLYSANSANHFTYNRVNWKLHIRKEVFSPNEVLSNPLALHLVFCQVVQDALSLACIRISREERNKMRKMLDSYGITLSNLHSPHHKVTIKKNIVDIAKDWPTYFARIFPITGSHQNPDVKHLAVSHSGIRLIRREKSIPNDYLQVLDTFNFDEVAETSTVKGNALQIILTSGTRFVFYTHRAIQIRNMIERYMVEIDKEQHEFVRAVNDHPTRDSSLLAFKKGDLIKVVNKDQYIQKGWLYGSMNGRSGVFPCDLVEVLGRNEAMIVPGGIAAVAARLTIGRLVSGVPSLGSECREHLCVWWFDCDVMPTDESVVRRVAPPSKRLSTLFRLIHASNGLRGLKLIAEETNRELMEERDEADTRQQMQDNMQSNWKHLPDTLRRKLKHRESILAEFHADDEGQMRGRTISTDSLLSSSSGGSEVASLPPPADEESADSGTDGHAPASIASSDDEQQNRVVEECVRLDVIVSDGAYEDVEAPKRQASTPPPAPEAAYSQVIKIKLKQPSDNASVKSGELAIRLLTEEKIEAAEAADDEQAGTSDTLKDIQQTLQMLEEKVRMYETRLAVEHPEHDTDEKQRQQQKQVESIPQGEHDGWTRGMHPQVQVPVANKEYSAPPSGRMSREGRSNSVVHDGKHSLLQFAMLHFRNSPEKFEMLKTADGSISGSLKVIESIKNNKKSKKKSKDNTSDWTWKEQVDMVKFSAEPPKQSLLRLESGELSDLAIECFSSIMCYMGDLPMPPEVTEVKCVYTILMHCHKHESLRDEVYCQIMKQTTNNKSPNPDSCQRGWRLFSIIAAYFTCSPTLKQYLFKYLETSAYDKRRAYHGTATVCLQNLRKTFKYGGRKNVPSVEEITAISAGRNSKRQIYRLPGGTERVINTKSTTVVQDIIEEICTVIGVPSGPETEEFSLYCIVEGDSFTMPLAREEYVLDVTTELHKNQQVFYLIFCRSVWFYQMRLESALYVEVVFNQVAPDYLEGLLLVMPGEQLDQELVYDIAKVAALLHRAADLSHLPTMKETKFLLPRPALGVRDLKPAQWVNMVQASWHEVEPLTVSQAKAQVLELLSKWPLFGSSFFAVKRVSDPKERSDHILALNRHGVHFLDLMTHETLMHYPFSEVISTRKVKSEDGILYLDMKCGNLMQQRITRLQTDQAHEISRLIRQYISMEQRLRGGLDQPHDLPADISLNSR